MPLWQYFFQTRFTRCLYVVKRHLLGSWMVLIVLIILNTEYTIVYFFFVFLSELIYFTFESRFFSISIITYRIYLKRQIIVSATQVIIFQGSRDWLDDDILWLVFCDKIVACYQTDSQWYIRRVLGWGLCISSLIHFHIYQ